MTLNIMKNEDFRMGNPEIIYRTDKPPYPKYVRVACLFGVGLSNAAELIFLGLNLSVMGFDQSVAFYGCVQLTHTSMIRNVTTYCGQHIGLQ